MQPEERRSMFRVSRSVLRWANTRIALQTLTSTASPQSQAPSRAAPDDSSVITLSGKLYQLADYLEGAKAEGCSTGSSSPCWTELEEVLPIAIGMREVDTFLCFAGALIRHRYALAKERPSQGLWLRLIESSRWAGCEAKATEHYSVSRRCKEGMETDTSNRAPAAAEGSSPTHFQTFSPELSRAATQDQRTAEQRVQEALYVTEGIIPLSLRQPCSSGSALCDLAALYAECGCQPAPGGEGTEEERARFPVSVAKALIEAMKTVAPTVSLENLIRLSFVLTSYGVDEEGGEEAGTTTSSWLEDLFALYGSVDDAQVKKVGFSAGLEKGFYASGLEVALDFIINCPPGTVSPKLIATTLEKVPLVVSKRVIAARRANPQLTALVERVEGASTMLEESLKALGGEPGEKEADENDVVRYRGTAQLAKLYIYLTERPEEFESKAAGILSTNEQGRRIAHMLPVIEYYLDVAQDVDRAVQECKDIVASIPKGKLPPDDAKDILLMHKRIVSALCSKGKECTEEDLTTAYSLVLVHKYHGLAVDAELVKLFAPAMVPRGDCRFFNLIDVCTLFSGNRIDQEVIGYMFQVCEEANDAPRARALHYIMKQDYPGYLAKLDRKTRDVLSHLKILSPKPRHLFDDEVSKQLLASDANGEPLDVGRLTAIAFIARDEKASGGNASGQESGSNKRGVQSQPSGKFHRGTDGRRGGQRSAPEAL